MTTTSLRTWCAAACATLPLLAACPRRPAGPARTSGAENGTPPTADASGAPPPGEAPGTAGGEAAAEAPTAALFGLIAPHAGYQYSGAVAGWAWKQVEGAPGPEREAALSGTTTTMFPAQQAGGFYPADPGELRATVEGFLAGAEKRAGVAVGTIGTVVVMAPPHHYPLDRAAVLAEDAYETPLGPLAVDTGLREKLVAALGDDVVVDSTPFRREHALEVQFPFLQVALPRAWVLPILVGEAGTERLERIGRALGALAKERGDVLVVASSDMSHFFTYDEAVGYDEPTLAALEALDLETFERIGSGLSGMCGYDSVRAALAALRDVAGSGARVVRLKYANSGDVTGERDRVVGYASLALLAPAAGAGASPGGAGEGGMFSREERQTLMDIAKAAVRAAVSGDSYEPPVPSSELLRRDGAAFVTLRMHGELRGCIGHVTASEALFECVAEVARSAALEDPRFDPVSPRELPSLTYEISVLTPPEPVTDPTTIVVGRDGLIMSRGLRRGLLLPQVPGEQGWDREQFLDGTCRKAGLPYGCWRDPGTQIERFQAVVWGENLEDVIE